jgi:DNA helicase II / ATP-dependent DNA helicase PcrA
MAGSYPTSVPDLLDGLTPAQREAATNPGGPLLVIAGAGTGKTRTLVARFAWLVSQGVAPERILALTFSTAAADELRSRLEDALQDPYEELVVSTFHGFCARLLREEALEAGLDPFAAPVTAADRLAMLLERISELALGAHDLRGNPAALLASFIERIDRLKDEMITAADYASWAAALPEEDDAGRSRAAREREFAQVYADHDRMLTERGALDFGDLQLHAFRLLRERPHVRARVAGRFQHVLVDEFQDTNFAQGLLLQLLGAEHRNTTVVGDDDQAIYRFRGASTKNLQDFAAEHGDGTVVRLERSFRSGQAILDAAHAVVAPNPDRIDKRLTGEPGGSVGFWCCSNERAQAQAVAAEVEQLVGREGMAPSDVCVLVRSVRNEGQAVAVALEERAVPFRLVGAAAFFQRAEIRDVLAWLRLLVDPSDAAAVVRSLARPPIELRSIDIARCTQIARRRKLDMISALVAATEAPQIPPEARDRILTHLKLYRAAAAQLDTLRPDLFVHRLIDRLGLRRQQLFAAQADVVERLRNLAKFGELAAGYVRGEPQATPREFANYIVAVAEAGLREEEAGFEAAEGAVQVMTMHAAKGLEFECVYVLGLHAARMPGGRRRALEPVPDELLKEAVPPDSREAHAAEMRRVLHVAMTRARRRLVLAYPERADGGAAQPPSPFVEEARAAVDGAWEQREEELFGPAETLHATFRLMREELLETVSRVGGRLNELRFDTDLDVAHAVVRYLELIKLAALADRPTDQSLAEAIAEVNARLLGAATPVQREVFETSGLDDYLLEGERAERRRALAVAARDEPSLEPFLPRRGEGLMLSASDIETYRTCPLKYKFARVFRIPQEPTINQRFGILVHQVLERFHAGGGTRSLAELLGLLDAGWRRGGFGDSDEERQLRGKATAALTRYHERFQSLTGEPVWFERPFAFKLGPHLLRGRVDRVDRLPDGGYELIDYKTGRPKSAAQLKEDVQLSLYAIGAREAWQLEAALQSYYYVLDDEKVPVERSDTDREWIRDTVAEVADGILSQGFEPTPSYAACSICDFRIVCPAAER